MIDDDREPIAAGDYRYYTAPVTPTPDERIAELERLNLEAQNRIADLCELIGNIEQCRAVEGDSVTILCDNPEADSIETQGAVEVCGDYTGYELQRFYGKTWEEAIAKAARVSQRHYAE
jgi:hypothetical protein